VSIALAEERFDEPRGIFIVWFGFLGPPAAWKLQLMVNYVLVPYACWHNLSILIHLASLGALALAAGAGWVAWGTWKSAGGGTDTERGGAAGRAQWMGLSGALFGAFFGLIIIAQWIPNLLLSPCWG
jgi:hypothetical protein